MISSFDSRKQGGVLLTRADCWDGLHNCPLTGLRSRGVSEVVGVIAVVKLREPFSIKFLVHSEDVLSLMI